MTYHFIISGGKKPNNRLRILLLFFLKCFKNLRMDKDLVKKLGVVKLSMVLFNVSMLEWRKRGKNPFGMMYFISALISSSSGTKPRMVPTINILDTDAPDPKVKATKSKLGKAKKSKTKSDW